MPQDDVIADRLDEIAKLLALMLRRQREETLQEFVGELAGVAISPNRIAVLAATTPGYVSVALSRSRKKTPKT